MAQMEMDWTTIIVSVVTAIFGGGVGVLATLKATRRKAEFEVWERQLDEMKEELTFERQRNHELMEMNIEKQTKYEESVKRHLDEMDDKTQRIRQLQEQVTASMVDVAKLTRVEGELRLELKDHRCVNLHCPYRRPENEHSRKAKAEAEAKAKTKTARRKRKADIPTTDPALTTNN